jgi:hypothetical protein
LSSTITLCARFTSEIVDDVVVEKLMWQLKNPLSQNSHFLHQEARNTSPLLEFLHSLLVGVATVDCTG